MKFFIFSFQHPLQCFSVQHRAVFIPVCNTADHGALDGGRVEVHQDVWNEMGIFQSPQEEEALVGLHDQAASVGCPGISPPGIYGWWHSPHHRSTDMDGKLIKLCATLLMLQAQTIFLPLYFSSPFDYFFLCSSWLHTLLLTFHLSLTPLPFYLYIYSLHTTLPQCLAMLCELQCFPEIRVTCCHLSKYKYVAGLRI